MKEQKIKVLYVITKSNFGGAQRYVYDLTSNLPRDQFESVVAFGGTGARDAGSGKLKEMLESIQIRTVFVENFMREISLVREAGAFFEVSKIIRKERPHVLHLNSSKAGGLGALAGRLVGVQNIVFTVHGWPFAEIHRGWLYHIAAHIGSWLTVLLSHKVILISKDSQTKARWMPFVQHKFVLIHNGIEPFEALPKAKARDYLMGYTGRKLPDDAFWIGTGPELTKNKGLSYAVEACAQLRDKGIQFIYLIIGEGEEQKSLEQLIEAKKLEGRVFLIGFVPEVKRFLKAFDIFLQPSLKEGLPYMLLEAGTAEVATVATGVGGIPDIIEHGRSGLLVSPKDPRNIVAALEELINKNDKRARLAVTLKRKVGEKFGLQHMLNQTLQLYEAAR